MRGLWTPTMLTLLILCVAIPAAAFDMEAKTYYGHAVLTLPLGDFGDAAGAGFGVGGGMRVPHDTKVDFRGEISYIRFTGKTVGSFEYSNSMIPLMAVAEYKPNPQSRGYGVGGLGFTIVCTSWEDDFMGTPVDQSESSLELTLSVGGGYRTSEKFSIEGRLNFISDAKYLSVHGNLAFGKSAE